MMRRAGLPTLFQTPGDLRLQVRVRVGDRLLTAAPGFARTFGTTMLLREIENILNGHIPSLKSPRCSIMTSSSTSRNTNGLLQLPQNLPKTPTEWRAAND